MAIPPGFIDELKNRLTVSEIVGKRVKLTKKGREHSGLCPFHNEKSPSFTVNDDKGFYHCFGCGAHGSALDFVINTEGLNFPEAVERLAVMAGMEVPQDTPEQRERTQKRNTLYDVMEAACAYYERSLRMPEGKAGLDYLRKRGLSEETIKRFRLGFASNAQGMKAALKRDGIEENLMIEAGLLIQPDDKNRSPYERFRDRVMFPITDRRGKVIAFGGRLLGDGKPKYLNSPDTPLFHKGTVLYGLAQARESAHKKEQIIVTEGYMDVIALAQGGFPNAVAPLGTALTEEQIQLLWKMSKTPVLCFDGDAAGQRAALRGAERALPHLKPSYSLHFVHLPEGEDPDSLIKAHGSSAMDKALENAIALSELLWRHESEGMKLEQAEDRAALEDHLKKHAFQISDESVKHHFLSAFKDRIWQEIRKKNTTERPRRTRQDWTFDKTRHHTHLDAKSSLKTKVNAQVWREHLLLAALILHPEIMDEIGEKLGLLNFNADSLDNLRQEVLKTVDGNLGLDSKQLQTLLIENGFSGPLHSLLGKFHAPNGGTSIGHESFLHPDRPVDDVLRGWNHTFSLYVNERDLAAEFEELKRRLSQDMTPQLWSQFQALQKLRGMVDTEDDEAGGYSLRLNEDELFD